MRNLLLGMTAAAAFALAVPGAALAQGDHGGRGGAHVSGGGGSHGGGRAGGNANISGRSMNVQGNVSGNSRISSRESHRGSHHMRGDRRGDRNFVDSRSRNRITSNDWDRRHGHHRHHRHHRNFNFFVDTPGFYYDDYASYDTCYQYVWTRWGYRYVNTCASYYYNVY